MNRGFKTYALLHLLKTSFQIPFSFAHKIGVRIFRLLPWGFVFHVLNLLTTGSLNSMNFWMVDVDRFKWLILSGNINFLEQLTIFDSWITYYLFLYFAFALQMCLRVLILAWGLSGLQCGPIGQIWYLRGINCLILIIDLTFMWGSNEMFHKSIS